MGAEEPGEVEALVALRVRGDGLDDRPHGEQRQRDDLQRHEDVLHPGRDLDADGHEDGDEDDPGDAAQRDPEDRVGQAVGAEEQERVVGGDPDEVGHHDDRGGDGGEAEDPADGRAEGARRPDEGLAAVGIGAVHVVEARRDEQHRDEGEDHDERALQGRRRRR